MRDNKFRVWHRKLKEWHYFRIPYDLFPDIFPVCGKMTKLNGLDYENWCQFTGLNDKNGKEVYEGDIVESSDCLREDEGQYVVKWKDEDCCYRLYEMDGKVWHCGFDKDEVNGLNLKVIGNTYEDPELLSGEQLVRVDEGDEPQHNVS